jgi:chemotaxis signal transduction protein
MNRALPDIDRRDDQPLRGQAVRCGRLSLAWPHGVARAVMDCPPLSAIPNAASWLAGAANIDGRIVPVLDLAAWFVPGSMTDASARDARLLVLGDGEDTSAVLFEGLPRLVRLTEAAGDHALDTEPALSPYVIGFAEDDPSTLLLDHPALMQALQARLSERG